MVAQLAISGKVDEIRSSHDVVIKARSMVIGGSSLHSHKVSTMEQTQ